MALIDLKVLKITVDLVTTITIIDDYICNI